MLIRGARRRKHVAGRSVERRVAGSGSAQGVRRYVRHRDRASPVADWRPRGRERWRRSISCHVVLGDGRGPRDRHPGPTAPSHRAADRIPPDRLPLAVLNTHFPSTIASSTISAARRPRQSAHETRSPSYRPLRDWQARWYRDVYPTPSRLANGLARVQITPPSPSVHPTVRHRPRRRVVPSLIRATDSSWASSTRAERCRLLVAAPRRG